MPFASELTLPFAVKRVIVEGEEKSIAQIANIAIREYCLHSYLYYDHDISIIDDTDYDTLCKWLNENLQWLSIWDINDYLDAESLSAGTGYGLNLGGLTLNYCEKIYKGLKDEKTNTQRATNT